MVYACNTMPESELAELEVRLHDNPLEGVEEVNVMLNSVEIQNGSEWKRINSLNQLYDLLSLTNGTYAILGDTLLEPGIYNRIRLTLNETGHYIMADGENHDLILPNPSLSAIEMNIETELTADKKHILLLDFDAANSVIESTGNSGNPSYLLIPVVRANILSESGIIQGSVTPAEALPFIYAINQNDTLASTLADSLNGEFLMPGLPEGIYRVAIEPRNTSFISRDVNNVQITTGEITHLGEIELIQAGN